VTYPQIFKAQTTPTTSQQTTETQHPVQRTETRTNEDIQTTPNTKEQLPTPDTTANDQECTEVLQETISSDHQIQSDQNWNALKIVRQSTRKGKPRCLVRWEDTTAPGNWCDSADVNDELKRVFYLTDTKTGFKRVHPLEDKKHPTLAVIWELEESMFH